MDILAELLADTREDSLPRQMAEKAAELYRLSMGVVERFAFPHTSINVGVWAKGKPSHTTKKLWGSGLSWGGASWSLDVVNVPDGPACPWGRAWLLLPERPALLRHHKRAGEDLYQVDLFRWCLRNPGVKYEETLYTTWKYKRFGQMADWYTGVSEDMCCFCKERSGEGKPVYITKDQLLFCETCAETRGREINEQYGAWTVHTQPLWMKQKKQRGLLKNPAGKPLYERLKQ